MLRDERADFGANYNNSHAKIHGAYSFICEGIPNAEVHEPVRYSQATRDFIYSPVMRGIIKNAIDYGSDAAITSVFNMLAYAVVHDRKHLSRIEKNISDKRCIVLTEYNDIAKLIASRTVNGAIVCCNSVNNRLIFREWASSDIDKPLIMSHRDFIDYFVSRDMYMIPEIHIVDLPIKPCAEVVSRKIHIYPIMGNIYSYMLKIAYYSENKKMMYIETSLRSVIGWKNDNDGLDGTYELAVLLERDFERLYRKIRENEPRIKNESDSEIRRFILLRLKTEYNKLIERMELLKKREYSLDKALCCDPNMLQRLNELTASCKTMIESITDNLGRRL